MAPRFLLEEWHAKYGSADGSVNFYESCEEDLMGEVYIGRCTEGTFFEMLDGSLMKQFGVS